MKTLKYIWLILLFLSFNQGFSQQNSNVNLSKGASVLFNSVKSKLSVAEKNEIFTNTGFVLTGNKDLPFAADNQDALNYPYDANVYVTDLNNDGNEEIFIVFGNSYTSGMTGSSAVLFIKNNVGKFAVNLGFPASLSVLPTSHLGYPDLLIGGPGFEFPVWRWNGKEYDLYKTIKNEELEKISTKELSELSDTYQKTIKN
ncbi:MAG: hypothetical protein ABI390_05015 [Daejeonella sp.]